MGTWNDTDVPRAYLITFRTYGTWLPGDERGSIDRFHNKYGGPRVRPNAEMVKYNTQKLKSDPVIMNASQRAAVNEAVREVCRYRNWHLYALSVRTNHVHAVIAAIASSKRVLNDFKAYATRNMRKNGLWIPQHSPWVDKGSRRNLWNDEHILSACDYVNNRQGGELPEFD